MEYKVKYKDELYHHGILGQKWGKRNGPPYPLDAEDHSAIEKKAGYKKSLKKLELSDNQKRLLKVGAAVAVAGLATYGAYKLRNVPSIRRSLKNFDIPSFMKMKTQNGKYNELPKMSLSEQIEDAINNANSVDSNGKRNRGNCPKVVTAFAARIMGKDVEAMPVQSGEREYDITDVAACFKDAVVKEIYGSSSMSGKEFRERIQRNIVKQCVKEDGELKDGAVGAVAFSFNKKYIDFYNDFMRASYTEESMFGHTLNWVIENQKVRFADGQQAISDASVFLDRFIKPDAAEIVKMSGHVLEEEANKFIRNKDIGKK